MQQYLFTFILSCVTTGSMASSCERLALVQQDKALLTRDVGKEADQTDTDAKEVAAVQEGVAADDEVHTDNTAVQGEDREEAAVSEEAEQAVRELQKSEKSIADLASELESELSGLEKDVQNPCTIQECLMYGDPHVSSFNRKWLSLIENSGVSKNPVGEYWLINDPNLQIQVKYGLNGPKATEIAMAGYVFGQDPGGNNLNVLTIGSNNDGAAWNDEPILCEINDESCTVSNDTFTEEDFSFNMSAIYKDVPRVKRVMNNGDTVSGVEVLAASPNKSTILLDLNITVIVNVLSNTINAAIYVCEESSFTFEGGLCSGNEDTPTTVPCEESLWDSENCPTPSPTVGPTPEPTTMLPTPSPTAPTVGPTSSTVGPTPEPTTMLPTPSPTAPTVGPTPEPTTQSPTKTPTPGPTACDSGTCNIYGDPHVTTFGRKWVSLLQGSTDGSIDQLGNQVGNSLGNLDQMANLVEFQLNGQSQLDSIQKPGDFWLIKSRKVHIQAKYGRNGPMMTDVAIGGDFMQGNVLTIGAAKGNVTWNGKPILYQLGHKFRRRIHPIGDHGADWMVALYHNQSSMVTRKDGSPETVGGIDVQLPLGAHLTVNRLSHTINAAISLCMQNVGYFEGYCGQFEGEEDAKETNLRRSDTGRFEVAPGESLFHY